MDRIVGSTRSPASVRKYPSELFSKSWAFSSASRAEIRRPKGITIEAIDLEGQPVRFSSDQLQARIWQHETDHLDGVLIIDRMTPIDKMANQRKLRELEQQK